jgi:dihydrofolate reductase
LLSDVPSELSNQKRARVVLVAAVARNGVIGHDGDLPWRIPEDLKHFKTLTLGGTLVMGRKTYDSIGRPLPGRRTIVVTRQRDWSADGVETALSLDEALALAGDVEEVFIVGGAEIYRQAMPFADVIELTEVDQDPDGDTHFPQLPAGAFVETRRDQRDGFAFVTLERKPLHS